MIVMRDVMVNMSEAFVGWVSLRLTAVSVDWEGVLPR